MRSQPPRGRASDCERALTSNRGQPWSNIIGLDVSLKDTSILVRQDGKHIWRGKCATDAKLLAEVIRKRAPRAELVVFETGPLSMWFYHALTAEGLLAICIDERHAKAALDIAPNNTDTNGADGFAQLAEVGFYRAVRVKGFDSTLHADHRAPTVPQKCDSILQPDTRADEDVRTRRA